MIRGLFVRIVRWRVPVGWYALAIGVPLVGTTLHPYRGPTRLLSTLGDRYPELLEAPNRLVRSAITEHCGIELSTERERGLRSWHAR